MSDHREPKSSGPGVAKAVRPATDPGHARKARELAAAIVAFAALSTVGQSGVARSLGVSTKLVWNWSSPDAPHDIDLQQILMADPRFARAVLQRALAYVESLAVGKPIEPAAIGVDRRARRATVAHGRVLEALEEALADGEIDTQEAKAIVKAVREERTRLEALEYEVTLAVAGATR